MSRQPKISRQTKKYNKSSEQCLNKYSEIFIIFSLTISSLNGVFLFVTKWKYGRAVP